MATSRKRFSFVTEQFNKKMLKMEKKGIFRGVCPVAAPRATDDT